MLGLLVLAFILVPIAELAVIIQVGQEIGVWWTIGILIADSLLGSLLMRSQGRAVWRRFTEAINAGRPPAGEVLDGSLVLLGGALLLTPGFLTDLLGLSLLLPPSRALWRRIVLRRVQSRIAASLAASAAAARPRGRDFDVEGTATEVRRDLP